MHHVLRPQTANTSNDIPRVSVFREEVRSSHRWGRDMGSLDSVVKIYFRVLTRELAGPTVDCDQQDM